MQHASSSQKDIIRKPPFLSLNNTDWARSKLASLSLEEKIGQLLHVAAYSNRDKAHVDYLQKLVEEENIGGLIFFQGNPGAQAVMTNQLQQVAKVPLMISIDGEWGLAMRLNDTIAFPYQIALGAMSESDNDLIYEMGKHIGLQCKALGIHVNFAPTIDINSNPANPVIGFRSFGENKENVTTKALAYVQGMQDVGVLACAKHFPGHGDTDSDSHFTLPLIKHNATHLHKNELYPFKILLEQGIGSMMVAHLNVPALEKESGLPSTLSHAIITKLLKEKMGFDGLIFTDALDMKGVSAKYAPGDIETSALLAGNDVLLFTVDVKKAKEGILQAIEKGGIAEEEIDARCFKQLLAKQWMGLDHYQPIVTEELADKLHKQDAIELNQLLCEKAITIYRQTQDIFPLKQNQPLTLINAFGDPDAEIKLVKAYDPSLLHHFKGKKSNEEIDVSIGNKTLLSSLLSTNFNLNVIDFSYDDVAKISESKLKATEHISGIKIIALHLTGMKTASGFGITEVMNVLVERHYQDEATIFVLFGNVYALNIISKLKEAANLILCYQDSVEMQQATFKLIKGELKAVGKLPVAI
jgi:beta-glucosidase-like glycosyl hydrolase